MRERRDPEFERLLEFVRDERGFDYTGYKRPTLTRRFRKRMDAVGAGSYEEYRHRLEEEPGEFAELFNTILINVTGFFRDGESWEFVRDEVLPKIISHKSPNESIRVWSAGCASGEEPYTLSILFAEALGDEEFRSRVKVYATDIDEQALTVARHAIYSAKQLAGVPADLRERYFKQQNHGFVFRNEIRRNVIFGRNDLLRDPPISRVDLLVCRNTLMYFQAESQTRILGNFYFALSRQSFLMLGKAEALQSRSDLFEAVDLKRRVYVRVRGADVPRQPRLDEPAETVAAPLLTEASLRSSAFDQTSSAQIVVDLEGHVAAVNHSARALFGLDTNDLGRPLQDLEMSYRPVELRSLIDQVRTERRLVSAKEVEWSERGGEKRRFDVQVAPIFGQTGDLLGVTVVFADVTRFRLLNDELEQARRDLESAYEELQSTVEELETTNEELQSTNEELETTNEELQSTNEELETMNEELQSTNEELETMNDELRERTDDALRATGFFTSVLSSIQQSLIVVDPDLRVQAWSRAATDLFGPREDEVMGEHFLDLDIGLSVSELRAPIRRVLSGDDGSQALELKGHDRRGHPISCDVLISPLRANAGEVSGAIVILAAERTT